MQHAEFMRISPRYFAELVKRYEARCRRADEMTEVMGAQIVAMVQRCGFVQFKDPGELKDFMPSEWRRPKKKPAKQRNRSHQAVADEYRKVMDTVAKRVPV